MICAPLSIYGEIEVQLDTVKFNYRLDSNKIDRKNILEGFNLLKTFKQPEILHALEDIGEPSDITNRELLKVAVTRLDSVQVSTNENFTNFREAMKTHLALLELIAFIKESNQSFPSWFWFLLGFVLSMVLCSIYLWWQSRKNNLLNSHNMSNLLKKLGLNNIEIRPNIWFADVLDKISGKHSEQDTEIALKYLHKEITDLKSENERLSTECKLLRKQNSEFEQKINEKKNDTEKEKPELISEQFEVPAKPEQPTKSNLEEFFMTVPGDGFFNASSRSNFYMEGATFYLFEVNTDKKEALFSFVEDKPIAVNFAIGKPQSHIILACDSLNTFDSNARKITTQTKGIAILEGEKWIIKDKAKIIYE